MNVGRRAHRKRSYLPKVEALEALRLMDAAATSLAPFALIAHPPEIAPASVPEITHDAWDAALSDTRVAEIFSNPIPLVTANPEQMTSGLRQLDRYLGRSWVRAGIPSQSQEDCTQAVYTTLLQNWGRPAFDQLLAEVGAYGVKETLSRETAQGPEFFRAIDTVKKRAQRQKTFAALDEGLNVSASGSDGASESWRGALHEAIANNLNPREADLIRATLKGETPAEIAQKWGVAPKTVSNEKTRAIQKLREALVSDLAD